MNVRNAHAAEATVDLGAVRHNVGLLREAARGAEVMAVVKADGYGHGEVPVARAALAAGARWLGTATLAEALRLRDAGIDAPVLCWLHTPGAPWESAAAAGIDVSASEPWAVGEIAEGAARAGVPARVHLKVDTGLGRGGAAASQWLHLVEDTLKAQADGLIELVGVWSHLGSDDDPRQPRTRRQLDAFREALEVAERAGARPQMRHLANSAATLTLPDAHFDLVRPGIAVYGLWPDRPLAPHDLRPAMTLAARLAQVKPAAAGQGVSYGHVYTTTCATHLGLVPLGYADGVPRQAGGVAPVLAAGRRRTIAGRVCMDQFMLDLGTAEAAAGDEVVLFGPGDAGEPTAAQWARPLGTLTNELVTGIGARVPRTYR
ncbi:alanine racemase [Streptomyces sp. TR06-5]|uniref:alanine racemase n=1 Tax=unclassified Streptomyces TaxID=2593676 RepID=UPI00399F8386